MGIDSRCFGDGDGNIARVCTRWSLLKDRSLVDSVLCFTNRHSSKRNANRLRVKACGCGGVQIAGLTRPPPLHLLLSR